MRYVPYRNTNLLNKYLLVFATRLRGWGEEGGVLLPERHRSYGAVHLAKRSFRKSHYCKDVTINQLQSNGLNFMCTDSLVFL